MYFYLSHLAGVTVKLQGKAVDIITAQQMVCNIQDMYASERTDIDGGFHRIFEQAVRMAESWQQSMQATFSSEAATPQQCSSRNHRGILQAKRCNSIFGSYNCQPGLPFFTTCS